MKIFPFQAKYPDLDYITSSDSFFSNVKQEYPEYEKSGFFKKSSHEGVYIYEIRTSQRTFTGLVACVDVEEYLQGNIKKHENTLASKEQRQMQLLLHRKAMVKPVMLFHQPIEALAQLMSQFKSENSPLFSTHFDQVNQQHTFWEVADGAKLQEITQVFEQQIPMVYIADGHHRTSTTALLYERRKGRGDAHKYRMLQAAFFSSEELEIHDYNRVIEALDDVSLTAFMARISTLFDIEILDQPAKPSRPHQISMFINREWYLLTWKPHILDNWPHPVVLDASLLDHYVLQGILGIEDIRTAEGIKYVEGPQGLSVFRSQVVKGENRVGFCLYPVSLHDMVRVADANLVMPPKSTWFEPRMKNGLIVYDI